MKRILTALGAALIGTPMLAQADAYHGRLGAFLIPSSDIEARSGAFPATAEDDGNGLGLDLELPIADSVVLTGEWFQTEYDDSSDLDHLRLGIGAVGVGGSGLFLEYTQIDPQGSGRVDGPSLHARLGGDLSDAVNLYGRIGYHFLSGDNNQDFDGPEFGAGLEFALAPQFGLFGEYRLMNLEVDDSGDELETRDLRLGVRFRF